MDQEITSQARPYHPSLDGKASYNGGGSNRLGPSNPPPPGSPIAGGFDHLAEMQSLAHSRLSDLENALHPVLVQEPNTAGGSIATRDQPIHIVDRLAASIENTNMLIARIERLHQRLLL